MPIRVTQQQPLSPREIQRTNRFKRQYKLAKKQGKNLAKLRAIIEKLVMDEPLPVANQDHKLTGNLSAFCECHIEPDWLLIYQKLDDGEVRLLSLEQLGSHAELF